MGCGMFKIACNWSIELYDLIVSGQVDVDYIKAGAFGDFDSCFEKMRALRPVLLHGFGHYEKAGMNNIEIVDFERGNRLLAECGSPHYGLHLCITNADMGTEIKEEDIHEHMCRNIRIFKKKLNVPLLLENIPDAPQEKTLYDHFPYSQADKISRVIHDNDVDLLLDITHAKIACMYRKWNLHDYLSELPLERVREIHVNGSGYDKNGFPDDTHNAMEDADYATLEWVLGRTNPQIVSLEYVGIPSENRELVSENIKKQLKNIRNL